MKIDLKEYILEKRQVLLAVALGLLIYSLVLLLYQIPPEAAGYGIILVFIAEFVWLLSGFGRFQKKQKLLRQLAGERAKDFYLRDLPESEDPKEEAYQDLIESLLKEKNRKEAEDHCFPHILPKLCFPHRCLPYTKAHSPTGSVCFPVR